MKAEFCRECGASFPPREGEGHCKDWKICQKRWDDYMKKKIMLDKIPGSWYNSSVVKAN